MSISTQEKPLMVQTLWRLAWTRQATKRNRSVPNPLGIPGTAPPVKVDQTFLSDRDGFGNCLQAAVATLFSVGIDDVVDLRPRRYVIGPSQNLRLETWLKERGWAMHRAATDRFYTGYYIATGLVRRSIYIPHAVVMYNGQLYHDPHPSRDGLCAQQAVLLFYPI